MSLPRLAGLPSPEPSGLFQGVRGFIRSLRTADLSPGDNHSCQLLFGRGTRRQFECIHSNGFDYAKLVRLRITRSNNPPKPRRIPPP